MILTIFKNDIRNLFRSFFAVVIVVGLCFIPALYAWMNIYSNMDPYGNTGNIKVAAVSMDRGARGDDGHRIVAGDTIIEELHKNDAISWQFNDTEKSAIEKVRAGDYYAALIIPEDFSESMYNTFSDGVKRPTLMFYQNQKKNAIANKITDTVVGSLQDSLNETFLSVVTREVFKEANVLADDARDKKTFNKFIRKLHKLKDALHSFSGIMKELENGNAILDAALEDSKKDTKTLSKKADNAADDIAKSKKSFRSSRKVLADYDRLMSQTTDDAHAMLSSMRDSLKKARVTGDLADIEKSAKAGITDLDQLEKDIDALKKAAVKDVTGIDADSIRSSADSIKKTTSKSSRLLNSLKNIDGGSKKADEARQEALSKVDEILAQLDSVESQLDHDLMPRITKSLDAVEDVLDDTKKAMNQFGDTLDGMGDVFAALQLTVSNADDSLIQTGEMLDLLEKRLDRVIEKVEAAKTDEKWDVLIDTLSGDPSDYAKFFSDPVKVNTEAVYPVKDYGSAVTPFYTILAIWVGGVVLAALLSPHVATYLYPEARDYELFLGRFLFFALISQIQAAIIVWGDIALLHVQCLEPFYFWLASAFAGLTFTMLIFGFVSAFGDIGKAAIVVMLVLQVAGSSGTYPIELLPEFFQAVYIFFPFPYGINALRECVGGMYGGDYWIYLMQLSVFLVVGLIVGIWIRRYFVRIMEYIEMRMEDTEMM